MKSKTLLAATLAGLAATLAIPAPALAADPIYTGLLSNTALSGYDTVAYFTQGRPVKGDAKFAVTYKGAQFRFANANHLAAFKANPAKYAPQYGGYCAWAVSQGYTASADPSVWKVVNGKLYLNYNQDIGQKWSKNIPGFIAAANRNWPSVLAK
jgi:YHS domain-containing protein